MMRTALFHMLPSGGGIRVVSQLLGELRNRYGWTLHLPEGAFELESDLERDLPLIRYPFPSSGRLTGLRRLAAPILLLGKLKKFRMLCRTAAESINSSADLALVHNTLIIAAPPLLEFLEIPSVYFCFEYPRHIYEPDIVLRTGSKYSEVLLKPLSTMERRMDKSSVSSASVIVTLSSYMQDRIRQVYGKSSVVVRPGVDTDFYTPDRKQLTNGEYILSIGALWPFKGHEHAVRSLARITEKKRPSLVVTCDREFPGYATRLERLSNALEVSLTILRGVPETELRDLYRGASLVLCAQHCEPYGLVPLEAMACGCPVIAVNEGGFPDNVSDNVNGFLIERDLSITSEAIACLMADRELARRFVENGRSFVKTERSIPGAAEELAAVLDSAAR